MTNDTIFGQIDPDDNIFNDLFVGSDFTDKSNYYSVRNFNDKFSCKVDCLKVCNYNIRSFYSNQEEFFSLLETLSNAFNVLVLTETRFRSGEGEQVEGYVGCHNGRATGAGGGVSVYCDVRFNVHKLESLCIISEDIETCAVDITHNGRSIFVIAVYRPPNGSIGSFWESLLKVLTDQRISGGEIIVTGDFNVNLIDYEESGASIRDFVYGMFSLNLLPAITKPTRFPCGNQRGSPSLLDHIWYNRLNVSNSGILLFQHTDHLPTFVFLESFAIESKKLVKLKFRNHSLDNKNKFLDECSKLRWGCFSRDVNEDTCVFINTVNKLYCKCFPENVKFVSQKRFGKPWLTSAIMNSIKSKSNYFKKYKLGIVSELFYKRYRNTLTATIKAAKKIITSVQ